MRALLCLLLSVCLLVSGVSPAFAQLQPLRKGAAALKGLSRKVGGARGVGKVPSGVRTPLPSVSPAAGVPSSLHSSVSRAAELSRPVTNIEAVRAYRMAGQVEGLTNRILNVPEEALRAGLLRGEFITLALEYQVPGRDLALAADFYRADLGRLSESFSRFSGQSLRNVFGYLSADSSSAEYRQLLDCRDALSSAAALGLFGTKADAPALIKFYERAAGTPFEPAAAAIAARGMLRVGAYEELSAWAEKYAKDDFFWSELSAYVEANGLPVTVKAVSAQAARPALSLKHFLRGGFEENALNADFSREATEAWMKLGTERKAVASAPAESQTAIPAAAPQLANGLDIRLSAAELGLTLAPLEMAPAAQPAVSQPAAPASVPAAGSPAASSGKVSFLSKSAPSSTSGILYSGIPVFGIAKTAKQTYQLAKRGYKWMMSRLSRGTKSAAVAEEPGLHENTVRPVYAPRAVEPEALESDEWVSPGEEIFAEAAEDGFKFTVENEQGVESILRNVDITIDSSIKTAGYNRVALSKDHIFELRNLKLAPGEMDHFFFEMSNASGELVKLGRGAALLDMPRPLRIKLEKAPNRRYQVRTLDLYHEGSAAAFMTADVDASLVPASEGRLVASADGSISFVADKSGKVTVLKDYYIRLPKEDSKYWARIMQQDGNPFTLRLHSTKNKTSLLTMSIPSLQIGLGKTTAPELNARTNLSESASSMIMLGINNVLPILMGFVHPLLKRYGEAAVARWGMGFFVASGLTALASGLYGGLGDASMTTLQTAAFITSSIMLAMGTNITRFVQNILISANRGKIVPANSFKKKAAAPGAVGEAPNLSYLGKRMKEVLKFKKGVTRDGALFQTASMFKNVGTMVFLMYPWLVNQTSELLFGVNPGLDFSASYVPYTLWAGWNTWKLSKTAYKDAFPMNVHAVENQFKETLAQTVKDLSVLPAESLAADAPEMTAAAKKLNGMIDSLTAVEVRNKMGDGKKLTLEHEAQAASALEKYMSAHGVPQEQARAAAQSLQAAFDTLGHRDVKLWNVFRLEHLTPGIIGMALATMHELSVSNGFAFAMHKALGEGTVANALTALTLYGSMSGGRVLGNLIARYISGGSMYALSSAFSIGGTAIMAAAGGDIGQLITGAVIASFGVGNFFSQMYEYMTGLYPKYKREISLLINYTMPAAAVMSFPMRWLVEATGISGFDLMVAGLGVTASVALTPGMLANSTVVQVAKYEGSRLWKKVKGFFKRGGGQTPGGLNNAAPAN